jgi:SAM-dependent methyltransferase
VSNSIAQTDDLELVRSSYDRVAVNGLGPVLDVGCGPGTVTAYLAALDVDVSGVDLSPQMITHARRRHPELQFAVASATDLDLAEASLGGILGWWSLFNLGRDVLPEVLASFARALVPGGRLVMGTHVGDGDVVRTEAYGEVPVQWTTHLWQPEQLNAIIVSVGLEPIAELRLPASGRSRAQVLLSARRPS